MSATVHITIEAGHTVFRVAGHTYPDLMSAVSATQADPDLLAVLRDSLHLTPAEFAQHMRRAATVTDNDIREK